MIETIKNPTIKKINKTYQPEKNCTQVEFEGKKYEILMPYLGAFKIIYTDNPDFEKVFEKLENLVEEEKKKFFYHGQVTASAVFNQDYLEENLIYMEAQNIDTKHLAAKISSVNWQNTAQEWLKNQQPVLDKNLFASAIKNLPQKMQQEGLCIREGLKKSGIPIVSGTGYELCVHCQTDNHSEGRMLFELFNKFLPEDQKISKADQFFAFIDKIQSESGHNPEAYKMLQTLKNSVLFLYGHWWSCKDCSDKIEKVGIKSVFISKKWVENNLSLIPQNSIKITSFTGDNLS